MPRTRMGPYSPDHGSSTSESSESEDLDFVNDHRYHLRAVDEHHSLTSEGARFNVQSVSGDEPPLLPLQDPPTTDDVLNKMAQSFYNPPASKQACRQRRPETGSSSQSLPRMHLHNVPPNTLVKHDAKSLAHIALVMKCTRDSLGHAALGMSTSGSLELASSMLKRVQPMARAVETANSACMEHLLLQDCNRYS